MGTEYIFDVPLPADLAAMITASGAKYANFKNFPKFSTEVIDGVTYSFVTTEIAWDSDKIDKGHIEYRHRHNGLLGRLGRNEHRVESSRTLCKGPDDEEG